MALDFNNVSICPQEIPEILGLITYRETELEYWEQHLGAVPGQFKWHTWLGDGQLGACCTNVESTPNIYEGLTDVNCFKSGGELCKEQVAEYFNRLNGWVFTAGTEEILPQEFARALIEGEVNAIQRRVSRIIWWGDTTNADTNLNLIDGLIKKALVADSAGNTAINLGVIDTGNVWDAVRAIIAAIPIEAREFGNIDIYMGEDVASRLFSYFVSQNLYHYNNGARDYYQPFPVLNGYTNNIQIVPVRGLDGPAPAGSPTGITTGNHVIIATPRNNIHSFTNLADDKTTVKVSYCDCDDILKWRLKFILGIDYKWRPWVVIAQITPEVLEAEYCINVCQNTALETFIAASPQISEADIVQKTIQGLIDANVIEVKKTAGRPKKVSDEISENIDDDATA